MKKELPLSFVLKIVLLLFGSITFTSCFGISMVPYDSTRDTITLDSNNHPIEYSGILKDIQQFGWEPFVSPFFRILSLAEDSLAQRYYENHYVYIFDIWSDNYEYVTIDSVSVSNARDKQFPFHIVNRVPFSLMGCCDSTIPDGMVPIDSIPCVVMTGQYKKCTHDDDGRKLLIIAVVVDRFRWWVRTLDFDIYLTVRGEQKHYHTSYKKKFWITLIPHC